MGMSPERKAGQTISASLWMEFRTGEHPPEWMNVWMKIVVKDTPIEFPGKSVVVKTVDEPVVEQRDNCVRRRGVKPSSIKTKKNLVTRNQIPCRGHWALYPGNWAMEEEGELGRRVKRSEVTSSHRGFGSPGWAPLTQLASIVSMGMTHYPDLGSTQATTGVKNPQGGRAPVRVEVRFPALSLPLSSSPTISSYLSHQLYSRYLGAPQFFLIPIIPRSPLLDDDAIRAHLSRLSYTH